LGTVDVTYHSIDLPPSIVLVKELFCVVPTGEGVAPLMPAKTVYDVAPLTLRQFSVTLPEETEAPSAGDWSAAASGHGTVKLKVLLGVRLEASQAGMASTNQKYVPGGSVGGENCVVDELAKTGGLLLVPRWMS
jgi:hypothetical protein